MHPIPTNPVNFDDLDDTSLVPTGKTARELKGDHAKTDTAAGISMGTRRSVDRVINQVAMFKCSKCRGSGRFISWAHRDCGPCNQCKGTGKQKTDPEKAVARKRAAAQAQSARQQAWIESHKAEWAWINESRARFDFAQAMFEAVNKYGALSDGQLNAVRNCIQKSAERAKERAERKPDVDVAGAGFSRMLTAFESAKAAGLKHPKFRVEDYTFSPAKALSTNAGCLYVKRGSEYVGKITSAGGYFASREATAQDRITIARIGADPLAAAVMHGKQTGHCSCCGRLLENKESVELGIGPVCREKWGL